MFLSYSLQRSSLTCLDNASKVSAASTAPSAPFTEFPRAISSSIVLACVIASLVSRTPSALIVTFDEFPSQEGYALGPSEFKIALIMRSAVLTNFFLKDKISDCAASIRFFEDGFRSMRWIVVGEAI